MIDIVIVNYNSTDYLLNCLESVYSNLDGCSAKVWVVDNASSDGVDRIANRFPSAVLTRNEQNLGFAAGVNQALQSSKSSYVVLLNPDSYIQKGFFHEAIEFMKKNPQVGIAGPRILDEDGSIQGSARAFPSPMTALFGRSSLLTRFFPNNSITSANILTGACNDEHPMEVDWVSGACMVVRRKAIDAIGSFDERFFMYWEDADWCRRMWEGGWKVVYFPTATVVHYVGASSNKAALRSQIEFHRSVFLLFDKYNPSLFSLFKIMVLSGLFIRFCLMVALNMIPLKTRISRKSDCAPYIAQNEGRKVKILRVIARLNIGGPSIHVYLLTTGLDARRFETHLVTGMISEKEGDMAYLFQDSIHKPYQVSELQRDIRIPMDIRVIHRIFKIICQFQPDIVHAHTAKAGFTARITVFLYNLIFRKNVKIVHTFHGHVFDGYFSIAKSWLFIQIERLLARVTDVIIAISESQQKDLAEKYHIAPSEKIRIIELGFDLGPFLSSARLKGRFRKKLGVSNKTLLIGIIGRLVPIKNHEMFFEAIDLFLKAHPASDVKVVVVGDGECRSRLEEYCRKKNLTRHIVFWGWIQDVSLVYADLDILALSSLNEGTPVSIIEAMASSVPVIATKVGGIQDLMGKPADTSIQNCGFTVCERGIICSNQDSAGFFQGLTYLAEEELLIKQARIQRARAYVVKRYAKERLLKDVESLYDQLIYCA